MNPRQKTTTAAASKGPASRLTPGLTPEQQVIVSSKAPLLVINAFAGTGKTTTLHAYAQARPNQRTLYLAFNRSAADEARAKMPPNVTVKTSHALAWAAVARNWPASKLEAKLTAWTLQQSRAHPAINSSGRAQALLKVINLFCQSSAPRIDRFIDGLDPALFAEADLNKGAVVEIASKLWERMSDPQDSLGATHDVYFKLWQLSRPRLAFDVILLDEAQDTNPALFDVFMGQSHAVRVLVGDRHQNIYSFRGAMNAMEAVREPHESMALTHSFRFGQAIADVANDILGEYKSERHRLTGAGTGPCSADDRHLEVSKHKSAMLMRTNAGLFDAAAALCAKGAKIGLLGKFEDYAFEDILDTHKLSVQKPGTIKSAYIRSFGSLSKMRDYAKAADDRELAVRIKVIEKYGAEIPRLHKLIQERITQNADLTLTTAHKAKGQEWQQVILGQDYPDLVDPSGVPLSRARLGARSAREPLSSGEANLWYVAVTRAREHLRTCGQLKALRSAVAQPARA